MRRSHRIVIVPHLRIILPISPPPRISCDLHTAAPHEHDDAASSVVESSGQTRQQDLRQHYDAARQNRLDIMSAARILFSAAEKPKKFGWDFHMWQCFVACLPPLAVYLCAQWIRSDMRKLEKEREMAKEEREKAKVLTGQDYVSNEDKESQLAGTSVNLSELPESIFALRARLDAMEEKIRRMELTSEEFLKGIRKETAPKSIMEDQTMRVSASMGLSKNAKGDKKNDASTNIQHGINSTSQEKQVKFQVSSSKNEDGKKR